METKSDDLKICKEKLNEVLKEFNCILWPYEDWYEGVYGILIKKKDKGKEAIKLI